MMKVKVLGLATQVAVIAGLMGACGAETIAPAQPAAGSWAPGPTAGSWPTAAAGTGTVGAAGTSSSVVINPGGLAGTGGGLPVAGSLGAAAGSGGLATGGTALPCEVSRALQSGCQSCHAASPTFGAPMALVTYEDLMKPSPKDASSTVAQAALKRMANTAAPMPPASTPMSEADKKILSDYLAAGPKPVATGEGTCAPPSGDGEVRVPHDAAYFKNGLTPLPGETCYELQVHARPGATDKTPHTVRPAEHYDQFYFKMPWGPGQVMTRFGSKFDNLKVIHHWLLFTTNRPLSDDGQVDLDVTGTTIGEDSQLLAGWAVGGDHVEFPSDTGQELPTGGMLNAQWHFYNQGTTNEPDSSVIQVCAVPREMRKNIASLTFLGTENFNGPIGMPARTKSDFSGSCTNNSTTPVSIYGFTPHMHELGINMKAEVKRAGASAFETVFDKPFDFNAQITYILKDLIVLQPGDTIKSTCTFNNHTDRSVAFGQSTKQEMCYNFTLAYPGGKLDNHTASLIGASNVCW